MQTGLAYRITGDPAKLEWEARSVLETADEILQKNTSNRKVSAIDEAAEWLEEMLKDGPIPSEEFYADAKANGFSITTLRRAGKRFGGCAKKRGMNKGWEWRLPDRDFTDMSEGDVTLELSEELEDDRPSNASPA